MSLDVGAVVREMRDAAGLSQRQLARLARTSQPAIARYESGTAIPSLGTVQRLAQACGRRVSLELEPLPDPHDVELAAALLDLTPIERLRSLRRYARLREVSGGIVR